MQKQILVVEDDLDLAKLLKTILEQNGYGVRVAIDGAEALDLLLKQTTHLVIADLKMKWVEGDIIVRLIKAHEKFKSIPILIYTGLPREEITKYALEGVKEILQKPVESKLLLEKIKEALLE